MRTLVVVTLTLAGPLFITAGCTPPSPIGCDFEGEIIRTGARVPAGDDCNTCTCRSDRTLSCTENTCEPVNPVTRDGGPSTSDDAGAPDAGPVEDCPGSPCLDLDEDGFYTCIDENCPGRSTEVDCDDERFFIQPGGYEFPDNGFDDNCNGLTDFEESPVCGCDVVADPTAQQLANAMDLCDETVLSVTRTGDDRQFAVLADYFGDVFPESGDCLTVMSTGIAGGDQVQAFGPEDLCGCGFAGCFDDPDPDDPGEDVCDLGQLTVRLQPPPNAKGIEFRFMFLSAEWPEFLCQNFNDTFYSLYESHAVNNGALTNVSTDPQSQQITVNVGFFEAPRDWSTALDNTPFGVDDSASCGFPTAPDCVLPGYCGGPQNLDRVGSGSGWLTTRAPFEPGEESIELVFSVHDEGDGILDSLVLIDRLRWVPFRPPVGTVKE